MLDDPTDSSSVQNSSQKVGSENSGSFDEIRSLKQAKWKSSRGPIYSNHHSVVYWGRDTELHLYYLMQFKADQVNQFLNAGIEQLEQKKRYICQ